MRSSHPKHTKLTAAILAGGQSRRMGQDKALLNVSGHTMLKRVCDAAVGAGLPVLVVGRSQPQGCYPENTQFVEDDLPDFGPIGGLVTALRHTSGEVLLLACDQPLLTREAVRWLTAQAAMHPDRDGIVAMLRGLPEPLFAIYRQSCLALAQSNIEANDYAMHSLIAKANFANVPLPDEFVEAVRNINTPDEWKQIVGDSKEW